MSLNFIIKTADGNHSSKRSFEDVHEFEFLAGPQYQGSDDKSVLMIPADKATELAIKERLSENQRWSSLAKNSSSITKNSPFLSHVRNDMKEILIGQLEDKGHAKFGNSHILKGPALRMAVSRLTDSTLGGLATKKRDGVSFYYDEIQNVGVVHDRKNKMEDLSDLFKRPLVDAVPNVTEFYSPDNKAVARLNVSSENVSFAKSEIQEFSGYYKIGKKTLQQDVTVEHPDFNGLGMDDHYRREIDIFNAKNKPKEEPDDMKNNIERPRLRPS